MTGKSGETGFDRDVPEHLREDVLQRICEAAWSGGGSGDISIIGLERLDALNMEFTGTVMIEGWEHWFHIRDGNGNGTEILGWNNDAAPGIDRQPRAVPALIPAPSLVEDAIFSGKAEKFLDQWNAGLDPATERGRALHDLPSKAAQRGGPEPS